MVVDMCVVIRDAQYISNHILSADVNTFFYTSASVR